MKGKCKKILSLMLVLAMVVQLFVGLGNEAQAETVNEITVTGLGGYSASRLDGYQEQIGFAMSGAIPTATWVNATILGDGFLLNGEQKGASQSLNENWYIQTTDSGYFVLTNTEYVPAAGDVISIPQDMQFQINGTTNVYKITNSISIKYDGTKWCVPVEADASFTIKQLGGGHTSQPGVSPVQIGFDIKEKINIGKIGWTGYNKSFTFGAVLLNDNHQSTWYVYNTREAAEAQDGDLILVCAADSDGQSYQPEDMDVIKFLAGMQYTDSATSKVYEIKNDFAIQWDATASTWNEVPVETSITERYTTFDQDGKQTNNEGNSITAQIGLSVDEIIRDEWVNHFTASEYGCIQKNGVNTSWYIQTTSSSSFSIVCDGYVWTEGDIITIPAGTRFINTASGNTYTIQKGYSMKCVADTTAKYGLDWITLISIQGRNDLYYNVTPPQIGFDVEGTFEGDISDWPSGTIGTVLLNGQTPTSDSAWTMQVTEANAFNLVCWDYTPVTNDIITIPADTLLNVNFPTGWKEYIIGEKFSIQYDGTTWVETSTVTSMTFKALSTNSQVKYLESTNQYDFQICIDTDQTGTVNDWTSGQDVEVYLNDNTEPTYATALWNDSNGQLFMQFQLTAEQAAQVEKITIKKGTEFTILDITYEVVSDDFTVYYYDDGLYTEPEPEAELIEIKGIYNAYQNPNNATIWEIRLATEPSITENTWQLKRIKPGAVNGNTDGTAQICWVEDGYLYLQPEPSGNAIFESLLIKKGTQFTNNVGTIYEIANDFTVYHKDGVFSEKMLYDITQIIDGTEQVIPATGTYTLPEIPSKEGHVALGWKVNEALYKVGTTLTEKEEGYTIEAVYAEFSQLKGAQVRLAGPENEKTAGIRFVCKLGKDSGLDCITQMGVLIIPTDYMTPGLEFTHDNYEKQTENYGTVKGYREFTLNKEDMKLETIDSGNDETSEDAYYLKAAIVNLYSYNYTRSYSARSFLAVQYAGEEEPTYVYTDYSKEDNARRICDIAKKMIETDPDEYGSTESKYPIVYDYAKVADTMGSFAFFGPKVVVTDGVYDVAETQKAMEKYAAMGFKYLLMDDDAYHIDGTYTTTTLEQEQEIYNDPTPRLPQFYLKKTMEIARQLGLEVIVNDAALIGLSKINIPLVETAESKDQVIAACLMYSDGNTVELLGEDIDESMFDANKTKYTYDGQETTVLHYVEQFDNYDTLKKWVAIKMSAYAKEDNFRGVRLVDEPGTDQFAAVALMTKVIKELYPNAYVQSSSLQSYSTRNEIGNKYNNWIDYWNTLLNTHTDATEVGINFYPYRRGDNIVGYGVHDNYLSSLQKLAATTRDRGLNLEFTIQAYANRNGYLNVDAAKLALQMHLALAFGTDTLGYFRYRGLGVTEDGGGGEINQTIESDTDLAAAVLSANRNGNYLKSHMTFFEYQGSMVFNKDNNEYVTTDNYASDSFDHVIKEVLNSAPILINQFKNEHTGQYGYYVVNLAKLHNTNTGLLGGGKDISNDPITITLSKECVVYQDYKQYAYDADKNEEVTNKVTSITLSDGQGAFIVVD